MTKPEFYANLIRLHKTTGQGLTGIVKINSAEISGYIDELIQEGLIKANHTGGSLGHPESNIFYTPTKGYNVWEGTNHTGNLLFVRIYLGIIPFEAEGPLQPGLLHWLRDIDAMGKYTKWLETNTQSLQEMLALDDFYEDKSEPIQLSEKEIATLKEKTWYKENLIVSECLQKSSTSGVANDEEIININQKLIRLYKEDLSRYSKDLEESQAEIDTIRSERKRINLWLGQQQQNVPVQSII